MSTDYLPPEEDTDIELIQLRQKIKVLEQENARFKATLIEHRLIDGVQGVSDAQTICVTGLMAIKDIQKKNGGYLDLEHMKIVDLLHKNLLLSQGKAVEEKPKKKEKQDVAKLLSIVSGVKT